MSVSLYGSGQTVIQTQSTTLASQFSSSSSSFVDVTGLSVTITPQSTTSKILVLVNMCGGSASTNVLINLVRNGTNIAQSTGGTTNQTAFWGLPTSYQMQQMAINYLDSPSTTSALTYKIQINPNSGTTYINGRATDGYYGGISSITVLEISGS